MLIYASQYLLMIHTFSKGICQKVNVIARLEFELIQFEVADQHFPH